ncbi:MAG: alpha/beta fold hydrolase [Pseudomonadota bacterium]
MHGTNPTPRPPKRHLLFKESRAAFDFASMWPTLVSARVLSSMERSESLVIVVPGFGSGDSYTLPLRQFLDAKGYDCEGWGLGTNLGGNNVEHTQSDLSERWNFTPRTNYNGEAAVPLMIDRLYERVLERHEDTGRRVTLIGWSLGGFMAREVARDLPNTVDRVVTLGSPVIGGPKYTAVAPVFKQRGTDMDWIEEEIKQREERPITQPITAIYSKSDGIVGWQATLDHYSPRVRHIEMDVAHLGMGFNRGVWSEVLTALRE